MTDNEQTRPARVAGGSDRKNTLGAGSEPKEAEPGKVAPAVVLPSLDKRPTGEKSKLSKTAFPWHLFRSGK